MAKTRRKSNGARRGAFKMKKMGKGWLAHRRTRGNDTPVVRAVTKDGPSSELPAEAKQGSSDDSSGDS